ncbi:hypothetical protein CPC08DRAFT_821586 [Agrocybe pediades]|nr:hypothetical protein CPC08DRAFT_821586 [Agrocybe pediades]
MPQILSTIQQDPLIFKKTLQEQFNSLIIRPLITHLSKDQSTQLRIPFLIVIDGLDECTDRAAQKAILSCLAESLRNSSLCIPTFVASRPEHDIKLSFSSKSLKDIHTCLSLDLEDENDSNSDIRLYLYDRFAEIKDEFDTRTTWGKLDQDWPGDNVIETLVRKASGQFIYAATAIRYVESTRHRPDHRLDIVLNLRPVHGDHPFAELDSLYAMILKSALDIEKVLHVLSLCFINGGRICCSVIEKLLSYDEGEVEALFCDMGALVRFELDESYPDEFTLYLRFLHASLRDYLLDASRSKEFHINMEYKIIRHVTHALRYLASCCSSSFHPLDIAGSPMYLLSASHYWMGQDQNSQIMISLELQQAVLSFPLKEFLEPHSTSSLTYQHLLQFFVTELLELLEAMVINNSTLSYIQDYQLGILRSFLLQQIQRYFDDERLALVLVLFYHLGSHRFVPVLQHHQLIYWHSNPFYLALSLHEHDLLSLSHIWPDQWVTETGCSLGDDNIYHCFVRQLLRDPGLTAQALGPVMHGRAALACLRELVKAVPLPPSSSENNIDVATVPDDAEDDAYPKLRFVSFGRDQWEFKCSSVTVLRFDDEELHFLSLGYLIFLLPRCGRSEALVAACEECKARLVNQPDNPFPVRRRLLCEEIDSYLARGLPTLHV